MKNYNQPNPDTGFISTIRDKITWIPLITFLCIIFMFFASMSIRSGDANVFTILIILCVI